jgi:hypothetical protein
VLLSLAVPHTKSTSLQQLLVSKGEEALNFQASFALASRSSHSCLSSRSGCPGDRVLSAVLAVAHALLPHLLEVSCSSKLAALFPKLTFGPCSMPQHELLPELTSQYIALLKNNARDPLLGASRAAASSLLRVPVAACLFVLPHCLCHSFVFQPWCRRCWGGWLRS